LALNSVTDGQIRPGITTQPQTDLAGTVQETPASARAVQRRFTSSFMLLNVLQFRSCPEQHFVQGLK